MAARADSSEIGLAAPQTSTRSRRATFTTRQEDIVRAAASVFQRLGYDKSTLDEVAQDLGVSKASIYYYFTSKEEVLYAICDQVTAYSNEQVAAILARPISARERVTALIEAMANTLRGWQPHVTVLYQEKRFLAASERFAPILARMDELASMVRQAIEEGIQQGEFRHLNGRLATFAMMGMINWAYQWYHADGPLSPNDVASAFADVLLNGLLAEAAPPAPQ